MGGNRALSLDLDGTDAVFRAVIALCLGQYHHSETQYRAAPGVETLHAARAHLRRLRSALALFAPLARPPVPQANALRRLSAALGAVRDLDVLLARVPSGVLHRRLAAAQAQAATQAAGLLHATPCRALLTRLATWSALQPPLPAGEARDFAAARFDRLRRKVKKAGAALADGDDEARHRLRLRVKRLRHASELLGSLFPASGRQARFMAALVPLQEALGALNDLVVAQALLARIDSSHARGAAALIGRSQRPVLLARAAAAHAELLAAPRFWR